MKIWSILRLCLLLLLLFLLLYNSSCKKDEETPAPPSAITSFAPDRGFEGNSVVITGSNFSIVLSENIVKFNSVSATVTAASATEITAIVPVGATTGKISVATSRGQATSSTDFTVLIPSSIASFSPSSGIVGTTVTITGSNFSSTASENTVKFNGTVATITSASATSLVVTVPSGTTTGKITVTVNGVTATSSTDFTVLQPPTITSFAPTSAVAGASVTIAGTNFSTTLADNTVKFNGVTATVTAATATQVTVTVPASATSGKISVTVNNLTATSASDFTFLPTPTIASVSPAWGTVGAAVTITGTNFSSTAANNTVKFNNTTATISSASATQLTVTVPSGATTGKITVTVNGITATSTNDFQVGCADIVVNSVTITSTSGKVINFNYELKNIGTVPQDLSHMYLQAYVSTDAIFGGDAAAGGFADYGSSEPLLQPNEVRVKTQSVTTPAASIDAAPYLIFQILSSVTPSPAECNATNNTAVKLVVQDIPRTGLVAFYPFNGNANDASGNNLNGTVTGATLTADRFGTSSKAYAFDGSGDFISMGNPTALQITNTITVGIWLKNTSFIDGATFLSKASSTDNQGFSMLLSSTGNGDPYYTIRVNYPGTGPTGLNFAGTAPFSANEWVFFAFTLNGSSAKFYKNGVEVFTADNQQPLNASTIGNFELGRFTGGGWDFTGLIDDVTVYNRQLSATEIMQLYNQTVTKY